MTDDHHEERHAREGERRHDERWTVDKKIPLVQVGVIFIQTLAIVWWIATTQANNEARLGQLEKESVANSNIKIVERLVTLEVLMQEIRGYFRGTKP